MTSGIDLAALNLTEREFQQRVTDLATLHGWRWYHTHDSRRSPSGFPDLVLVRPNRLIFAELKSNTGRTTPQQEAWLAALRQVSHSTNVAAYLWRPADWPTIIDELTSRP